LSIQPAKEFIKPTLLLLLLLLTPRKFITAKLSIRKPGSSSVQLVHQQKSSLLAPGHAVAIYIFNN
jgi:hypothetical protein